MIDKSRRKAKPGALPAFTPVPRLTTRHDGWTDARQLGFIEALADTGSVKAAAHRVNMTPEGAYHLRRHAEAATFRKAWEAALALGIAQLEDIAMERALYGQEVPVYSYGKLIGSRVVHNDRLLMFMLKNRAPTRFDAHGRVVARQNSINDPHHAAQLSRLKKQWRKEWEAEKVVADERSEKEVLDSIDLFIDKMRTNHFANMAPHVRAAYDDYLRLEQEDKARSRTALPAPDNGDGDGDEYRDEVERVDEANEPIDDRDWIDLNDEELALRAAQTKQFKL